MPVIEVKINSVFKTYSSWRGVSSSGGMGQALEKVYFLSQASICPKGITPFSVKHEEDEPDIFVAKTDEYNELIENARHARIIKIRIDPFLRGKILKGIVFHAEILGDHRDLLQRVIITYNLHGGYSNIEGTFSLFSAQHV